MRITIRAGFAPIEILAIIIIIFIVTAILYPVLRRARDVTYQAQCADNLRQIGIALQSYAQDNAQSLPFPAKNESWPKTLESYDTAFIYDCPAQPGMGTRTAPEFAYNAQLRNTRLGTIDIPAYCPLVADARTNAPHYTFSLTTDVLQNRHRRGINILCADGHVTGLEETTGQAADLLKHGFSFTDGLLHAAEIPGVVSCTGGANAMWQSEYVGKMPEGTYRHASATPDFALDWQMTLAGLDQPRVMLGLAQSSASPSLVPANVDSPSGLYLGLRADTQYYYLFILNTGNWNDRTEVKLEHFNPGNTPSLFRATIYNGTVTLALYAQQTLQGVVSTSLPNLVVGNDNIVLYCTGSTSASAATVQGVRLYALP